MSDWLNPLNRIAIQAAVRKRAKTCKTDRGVMYFDYDRKPDTVWISPARGSVPCGYYAIDRILDERWIATTD